MNSSRNWGSQDHIEPFVIMLQEWREKRMEDGETFKEEYDRLTHPPAEAQIDFGMTEAIQDGKAKDIHCLIMSLPYSNAGFTVPLPGENQQCFLEGLKMLFKQLGVCPGSYGSIICLLP